MWQKRSSKEAAASVVTDAASVVTDAASVVTDAASDSDAASVEAACRQQNSCIFIFIPFIYLKSYTTQVSELTWMRLTYAKHKMQHFNLL